MKAVHAYTGAMLIDLRRMHPKMAAGVCADSAQTPQRGGNADIIMVRGCWSSPDAARGGWRRRGEGARRDGPGHHDRIGRRSSRSRSRSRDREGGREGGVEREEPGQARYQPTRVLGTGRLYAARAAYQGARRCPVLA
eukprot:3396256-Rhodomonas_salina.4